VVLEVGDEDLVAGREPRPRVTLRDQIDASVVPRTKITSCRERAWMNSITRSRAAS